MGCGLTSRTEEILLLPLVRLKKKKQQLTLFIELKQRCTASFVGQNKTSYSRKVVGNTTIELSLALAGNLIYYRLGSY